MQLDHFLDYIAVLLNKGNAWAALGIVSGGGVTQVQTITFHVGGHAVTSVEIGIYFMAFMGVIGAINSVGALYERYLKIKQLKKDLKDEYPDD